MASVAKRKWTYKGAEREAWVVRYKDRGGAHRSRQFDRKKDADEYRRKVENELEAGTHVARRQSITYRALHEEACALLDRRADAGEISRIHADRTRLYSNYVADIVGETLLLDLTWETVVEVVDVLRTRYRKKPPIMQSEEFKPRKLANATIRHILQSFHQILQVGIRRKYIAQNIVALARPEISGLKKKRVNSFTVDEVRAILVSLDGDSTDRQARKRQFQRCCVYLAAFCGLRLGEILALKREDLDFDRKTIAVRRSLNSEGKLKGPKSKAGYRTVPMPRQVEAVLSDWLPFVLSGPLEILFTTIHGRHFVPGNFYPKWYQVLEEAGIPQDADGWRHFHALRHFAGSAWLSGGVPLPTVSVLLGHADPGITAKVYSHDLRDMTSKIDDLERCADSIRPVAITQELRKAA